jgi:hypothetical protein
LSRWSRKFHSFRRLGRTLGDIGPRRLVRRFRYEVRHRLDRLLPPRLALFLTVGFGSIPRWRPVLQDLGADRLVAPCKRCPRAQDSDSDLSSVAAPITFNFLGQSRQLIWPIHWNDPSWPRLWQFHLHYFDWARSWLEIALAHGDWPLQSTALEPLIDHWIHANPPARGDGWHSYTLSLRCRNWIWLFRCCPPLASADRLRSLWHQLCWLQAHPEHCHGGNHWLENLTALAIGGLQFDSPQAHRMQQRALRLLQQELARQVLSDGGHEERSASYHLLMLDRLSELACVLETITGERPSWLVEAVESMVRWAQGIRLEDGSTPRFNDSATDACPPLDQVIELARAVLQPCGHPLEALRLRLSSAAPRCPSSSSLRPPALLDLADTGWSLLRPGCGWELAFRCGLPCPSHLGAHAHSDLLSFDLWHYGRPVLAEVGTSLYGSGPDRQYERSSQAHNTLQLGRSLGGTIDWVEPVEVWAAFRAGRKARPHSRLQGQHGPWLWAAGSHDGYRSIHAQHFRWLAICVGSCGLPVLVVLDALTCPYELHWRGWWHLGPDLSPSLAELGLCWQYWPAYCGPTPVEASTYLARGFGDRQPRSTLQRGGTLLAGQHVLVTILAPRAMPITGSGSSFEGCLQLADLGQVHWHWPHSIVSKVRPVRLPLPIPEIRLQI